MATTDVAQGQRTRERRARGGTLVWIGAVALTIVGVTVSLIRYLLPEPMHQAVALPLYGAEFTQAQIPRYGAHPLVTFLHVVPGAFILVSGLIQFLPGVRMHRPALHRWLGRAHLLCAVGVSASALAVLILFPFAGLNEVTPVLFFLVIYVYSLAQAWRSARARRFAVHREWMLRAYSISLGIASVRLIYLAFMYLVKVSQYENFGVSLWAGFAVSLVGAEIWIERTRPKRREATQAASRSERTTERTDGPTPETEAARKAG